MKKSVRFILTVLVLGSYLLSACAGAAPQVNDTGGSPDVNSNEVVDVNDNVNDNSSQTNENTNDVQGNENDDNGNDNGDDNSNDSSDDDLEFRGVVEALTAESITINGVVYNLADFTEFKDVVSVGDQIKIHYIVNADGTFTIREVELSSGDDDNANYNSNSNNNDDSNGNSNDNDDDNSNNGNSNDKDDDKDNNNGNNNEKDDD